MLVSLRNPNRKWPAIAAGQTSRAISVLPATLRAAGSLSSGLQLVGWHQDASAGLALATARAKSGTREYRPKTRTVDLDEALSPPEYPSPAPTRLQALNC